MLICAVVLHNDCKLWKVIQRLLLTSSLGSGGITELNWYEDLSGLLLDWVYNKELSPMPILRKCLSLFAAHRAYILPFPQNSTRLCFSLFPFCFFLYFLLFYNFVFRSSLRLFFAHFGGVSWASLLWSCSFFFTPLLTCLTPAFALYCGLTLQLCHSINTL